MADDEQVIPYTLQLEDARLKPDCFSLSAGIPTLQYGTHHSSRGMTLPSVPDAHMDQ